MDVTIIEQPRLHELKTLLGTLERWPQSVTYDVGVTWVRPVGRGHIYGNVMGLAAHNEDVNLEGFGTFEGPRIEQGWEIRAQLRDPGRFPEDELFQHFSLRHLIWQPPGSSCWPQFGRSAAAAWLGISEAEVAATFYLQGDVSDMPQLDNVRIRLERLIRQCGG